VRWVVVGAGSAGCVVAARLAEAGADVVVVEAGAGRTDAASRSPSFFDATATPGLTFAEPFTRGRGVGGSSAVNGMIATPGDDEQYQSWGWSDTADAFARIRVPMEVPAAAELGPIDRALLATASDADRAVLTRHAGRRVTAFDAYLADVPKVEVVADVDVARITLDARRATGVELADGTIIEADAIVVSAGAIGSPLLLQASGVGGAHVGRHLRNHAALPVNLLLRVHVPWNPHGLVAATFLRRDDLQLLAVNHLGPQAERGAGFLVVAMSATGEGSVQPGPTVDLVLSDHDRARLAAGVELVEQLLAAPAFAAIVEDMTVGEAPAGVYHPTSTCRMGDVVDEDGAVIDADHLFVVDASVFPELPTANTYLPTLMLAERLVPRVLRRRRAAPPSTRGGGQ
jgi:choline dehydrogenase-like flavoprotein